MCHRILVNLTTLRLTTLRVDNVRFNLIHRPGSDLYLVDNDLSQTGLPADLFGRKDRQLVIKVNYLIQR